MADSARHPRPQEELLVYDELDRCPYLPGQVSRLPLRWPVGGLSRQQLDDRLAAGDRRTGSFLYHTHCPSCTACEPIRLDVNEFQPDETQRRTLRRGDRQLILRMDEPIADQTRVDLYNRHKRGRGLMVRGEESEVDVDGYGRFLVESCCDTIELSAYLDGRLVLVAVTDRGRHSLNAVYCCFDPSYPKLSLGTYSVLKHVDLCREWGLQYLYLGLYVAASAHMSYKARYLPHERLIAGEWRKFDRP